MRSQEELKYLSNGLLLNCRSPVVKIIADVRSFDENVDDCGTDCKLRGAMSHKAIILK